MDFIEEIFASCKYDDVVSFTDNVLGDSQSNTFPSVSNMVIGSQKSPIPFDAPVTMMVLAMVGVAN